MEQPADDIFSSKLDRSEEGEQGYRIKGKKGEEVRFVERIGLSAGPGTDLVTEIGDLLLPGTSSSSSFVDPGFSGFLGAFSRTPKPSRARLPRTCVYI